MHARFHTPKKMHALAVGIHPLTAVSGTAMSTDGLVKGTQEMTKAR